MQIRTGLGFDQHQLVENRKLVLGGVEIPFEKGLLGHSDADALLHAICDALLGSLCLGDLGKHFPDTDLQYKGASSRVLLKATYDLVKKQGYQLINLDSIVIAEKPKLKDYILSMRQSIAADLCCELDQISVKATTANGVGTLATGVGIAAQAIVLIGKSL